MNRRGFLGLLLGAPFLPLVKGAAVPAWHFSYRMPVERIYFICTPKGPNPFYAFSQTNKPEDWSTSGGAGYLEIQDEHVYYS
jgi:hypothetical protein